ncbi:MAG: hypothetical protein WC899_06410 [bacterium]|jgi:hypothetical protein
MITVRYLLFGVLLGVAATGSARAAVESGPAPLADAPSMQQSFLCPDLAITDLFRSKKLEYVHTLEFAEAMATVARGESPFAPQPVPNEWNSMVAQWYLHLFTADAAAAAGDPPSQPRMRFSAEEEPCDPALIHKASLEYRATHGNGKVSVVYPYYVPMGASELQEKIGRIDGLSERVASKIGLAERTGASKCSPGDIARAEKALELALRTAAAHHYDPDFAKPPFLEAERLADDLVENRRIANAMGFVCVSGQ